MAPRYAFSKRLRLHHKRDFERVFQSRCRTANRHLVVHAAPNGLEYSRLGLIVSRRHGPAVRRNRLKRLLRQAYRLDRHGLPVGYDFICIPLPGPLATAVEYQHWLGELSAAVAQRLDRRADLPHINKGAHCDA